MLPPFPLHVLRVAPVALTVVAAACTPFKQDPTIDAAPLEASITTSANISPDSDVEAPCDKSKPFGPATYLSGVFGLGSSGLSNVAHMRFSPDSLTAYFDETSVTSTYSVDSLYSATRATLSAGWGGIADLLSSTPALGVGWRCPTVSGDGRMLVFTWAMDTVTQIHYATASGVQKIFDYAGPLSGVSGPSSGDDAPFLREDGQVLYFASDRIAGNHKDIYRAVRTASEFGSPEPVIELNTPFDEFAPVVTPDDLRIYFTSSRPFGDAAGQSLVWTASRLSTSERFSEPTNVSEFNSNGSFEPSFVSRSGCTLYLSGCGMNWSTMPGTLTNGTCAEYVAQKPAP